MFSYRNLIITMVIDFYFIVFCILAILAIIIVLPIAEYAFKEKVTFFKISLSFTTAMFLLMYMSYIFNSSENYRFRETAIHTYASAIEFELKQYAFYPEATYIKVKFFDKFGNVIITPVDVDSSTWNQYSLEPSRKLEIFYLPNQQQKTITPRNMEDSSSYYLSWLCFLILCSLRFISSEYYGKFATSFFNRMYAPQETEDSKAEL